MSWRRVLWREWRATGDAEFAGRLFRVLGAEPAGVLATLTLLPIGAVLGALLAALSWLIYLNAPAWRMPWLWQFHQATLFSLMEQGALAGAALLLLTRLLAWRRFTAAWWLNSLLAWPLTHVRLFADFFRFLWFIVTTAFHLALLCFPVGAGVAVVGMMLTSWLNDPAKTMPTRYGLLALAALALVAFLVGDIVTAIRKKRLSWAMFALLCGMAGAAPLYLKWGERALYPYAAVVLLGIECAVWLHALMAGSYRGRVYDRRWLWWWWWPRPKPPEVEAALREAARAHPRAKEAWGKIMEELEARKATPLTVPPLLSALGHPLWSERFEGRQLLIHLGGPAMEPLAQRLRDRAQRREIRRLLAAISEDTRRRLGRDAARLLCPTCRTKCVARQAAGYRYYACRACGQSRDFLEGEVVLVLDALMPEARQRTPGALLVNWLRDSAPIDYDRIVIAHASEFETERFCMLLGNDLDEFRADRRKRIPVLVACPLEENALRVLKSIFGQVSVADGRGVRDGA
ncbi:MAG TPA: hypothetical protein PLZ36_17045 [Armatimonadota bacterium]|nr:hypothetical protein [Armatimonadota bacterium]